MSSGMLTPKIPLDRFLLTFGNWLQILMSQLLMTIIYFHLFCFTILAASMTESMMRMKNRISFRDLDDVVETGRDQILDNLVLLL